VHLSRRALLRAGLVGAATLASVGAASACSTRPQQDPFTLGVASGEPAADGMVLWTRLAVHPLAEDGLGGLGERRSEVSWQLAQDERFTQVVREGRESTGSELGHSVHVELAGLAPGREYFYRFRTGDAISAVGRTRTAPAPGTMTPLTMCFASCAHYEQGLYTAYRRLAEDEPDLVLHLGDYIYEYGAGTGGVRRHAGPETETLAQYRQRHAQYRTDPDLQAAHAVAPWSVVWDDHEVDNNWAGEVAEKPQVPQPDFPARRAAAAQAYWENMPLRASARPSGGGMALYRRVDWGALASFHMLDTRQYRDDQPCGDTYRGECPERRDPTRSLLGAEQRRWLAEGLRRSGARWQVLGQQVMFAPVDLGLGGAAGFNPDAWDGYPGDRQRVVDAWIAAGVRNAVVLTGDVHSHWAADLRRRWDDPASPVVGTELVTTSIASGGDGSATRDDIEAILPKNPHVRLFDNRRGFVRTRFGADELRADFRVLPYVRRTGAPAQTRATFVVVDGSPGLQPV